ncbi:MAG: nuclear transport factor 2 family protein [Candidatus Zixiibacteriota bacterium]|nr:MAG: nuclear transport factor 2 family protein [candidate division Zixibacteria bacterium]
MRRKKTKLIVIPLTAVFVATIILNCSLKPSPQKVVEDYVKAYNSHQVDNIMALYHDSVSFEVTGFNMNFKGKQSVRSIAEYDSVLNTIMTLSNISASGDTVYCSLSEYNNWVDAAEIPAAYYPRTTFVVKDNKITRLYAEIADSSLENFERVLDYFVFWGNDKYPEKMRKIAPDGDFIYNAGNGAMVVEMLREWKAEQKQQEPASGLMPRRLEKNK